MLPYWVCTCWRTLDGTGGLPLPHAVTVRTAASTRPGLRDSTKLLYALRSSADSAGRLREPAFSLDPGLEETELLSRSGDGWFRDELDDLRWRFPGAEDPG